MLLHISSSYAKILEETNFQPGEIPRSGSKAKEERGETERHVMIHHGEEGGQGGDPNA